MLSDTFVKLTPEDCVRLILTLIIKVFVKIVHDTIYGNGLYLYSGSAVCVRSGQCSVYPYGLPVNIWIYSYGLSFKLLQISMN